MTDIIFCIIFTVAILLSFMSSFYNMCTNLITSKNAALLSSESSFEDDYSSGDLGN